MARTVQVHLVDDLDGTNADETVKFTLDGSQYEIDLSSANAAKLREAFAPFIARARKASLGRVVTSGRPTRSAGGSTSTDREQNRAVRAWAKRHGKQISERGRIPQSIVDEYHGVAR